MKTLKIGGIAYLSSSDGLDMKNSVDILAEQINDQGGLKIGKETYKIEIIIYDSKNDQATAVSAANRLVFVDKVKFIMGAGFGLEAYLPITEANKVIVVGGTPIPPILSPKNKYSFQAGFLNTQGVVFWAWFAKKYPKYKHMVLALSDNQAGHAMAGIMKMLPESYGIKVTDIFYPTSMSDLSALGTKIKVINPDFMIAVGEEGVAYKAAWQAGYRGKMMATLTSSVSSLKTMIPMQALEAGFLTLAWPTEFEPALNSQAGDFKNAWIEKYGKWTEPEIQNTCYFTCLMAAFKKANSLDPDKVAAVIGGGLEFEGPTGKAVMISRPDMGNDRTIDSLNTCYIKTIKNGKPELVDTVNLKDGMASFTDYLSKQPKGGPMGPGGPGGPGGSR